MSQSIKTKTAIVTGAGSGISLEFARLLLQGGANVIFADLSLRPEAQELINAYQFPPESGSGKVRAVFQQTDVRDWTQLARLFSVAQHHFNGCVDIVCPGAGVYEPPFSNFWHPPGTALSTDDLSGGRFALIDINLTHPIRLTQLAISHFLSRSAKRATENIDASEEQIQYQDVDPNKIEHETPSLSNLNTKHEPDHLSIIHISSIAGQVTPLAAPMYNATKHALNGFVRSLAPLESRLGIRVVAVAPGVVKTPLWTDNPEKLRAVGASDGWITSQEVAEVMLRCVVGMGHEVSVGVGDGLNTGLEGDGGTKPKENKGAKIAIYGGSILEVSQGRVRDVKAFNDPGPGIGKGNTTSDMWKLEEEIWEALATNGWGAL